MPMYDVLCKECEKEMEIFVLLDNRHLARCFHCSGPVIFLISTNAKPVVLEYYEEHADIHVTGPAQRERELKRKGLIATG